MRIREVRVQKDFVRALRGLGSTGWIGGAVIVVLSLLGATAVAVGAWRALTSSHDEPRAQSNAMYTLLEAGSALEAEIGRTVRPAMERTEGLARSPDLVAALHSGNSAVQTALLNEKIIAATEIDAIALFDASGHISSINTCYADGKPIPTDRINRVISGDFSQRQIIQSCMRNNSSDRVLEFQTHCDITPAFFNSTGLSVAYSVPVINSQTGTKLGVLSSRLRFERLSDLIENRIIGGGSARAYFVTDAGEYFSEAINSGRDRPPVPVRELREVVQPSLHDAASTIVKNRGNQYLAVFSLRGFQTLEGGGIHILIVADGHWLLRGPQRDRLIQAAGAALIGTLLLILAGLIHARLAAIRTRRTILEASEANARLAAIVESSAEAIISDGVDGIIRTWNRGAQRIFGYSAQEAVGRKADIIEPADRPGEIAKLRRAVFEGSLVEQFETRCRRKDGRDIDVSVSISLIRSHSGQIIGFSRIARDITSQKRIELELLDAHQQLEARVEERTRELSEAVSALQRAGETAEAANHARSVVFDTALDAIVTVDSQNVILEWNLQAETMFRWDRTEAVGRRLDQTVISQRHWDAHRREIEDFIRTGDSSLLSRVTEMIALRRDGREFPVEIAITPAYSGRQCTFTAFIRDITVRKQAEADLRQAKEAAEKASRTKSEFLANMSHEIRTPLNGVIGISSLLLETALEEKQRRFAELIRTSGESLSELINDILDFSKIEAGKLEIEAVEFDLYAVIEDVTEMMSLKAAQKGLDLACLTAPSVPRHVNGDPKRVKQILVNLVNNAIKFTEAGLIATRLTLEEQSQEHVTVKFSITDTGIGIPADRMDRLFKSFSQVDASTTRTHGGTGLGLAISKQLAELMGGAIGVESTVGSGSTFWFTVRLGPGVQAREPAVIAAINPRGLRILAVHNSPTMREILRTQLCGWGLEAATASTGDEAMKMLIDGAAKARPFDVAILDAELPGANTLELGKAITSHPDVGGTVLLILLPVGNDFEPLKVRAAGFSGHLVKPVRQSQLYDSIVDAMASTRKAAKAPANPSPIADDSARRRPAATPRARILIVEDNRVNQIVASEMLASYGYSYEIVGDGEKAVVAVSSGSYDLVLMDCSMPKMDGFEATRQIRRAERSDPANPARHVPIIALTATAMKGDRERCLEAGMDDYVSKPLDPKRLFKSIEELLGKSGPATIAGAVIESAPVNAAQPATLPCDLPPPLGIDALLGRCMGNVETVRMILDEFEREVVADVAEIKRHVEGGDCEQTARVAHALKGASGILSADALVHIAFELEQMGRAGALTDEQRLLSQLNDEVQRCIDYLPAARAAIAGKTEV